MKTKIKCQLCDNQDFKTHIVSRDYFLTGEPFHIQECSKCGLRMTDPQPDKDEMMKYYWSDEYISHSGGKKRLSDHLYRVIRKIRIRNKYRLIAARQRRGNILDIGCGSGEFLAYLKQKGWKTKGIEPNEKARNFARTAYNLDVEGEEVLSFTEKASYDVITLWHVLEHIQELNQRMSEMKNILREKGVLIIALPNSHSPDAKWYSSYWAAWDVPRHLFHFTKDTARRFFEKHGFYVHQIIPMKFDAYYISLLSEKYKTGHSNYFKAMINGWRSNFLASLQHKNHSSLIYVLKQTPI